MGDVIGSAGEVLSGFFVPLIGGIVEAFTNLYVAVSGSIAGGSSEG